jgi:hypothetical protein
MLGLGFLRFLLTLAFVLHYKESPPNRRMNPEQLHGKENLEKGKEAGTNQAPD